MFKINRKFGAWAGITTGLITIFTATTQASATQAHRTDCDRVARADQALCRSVLGQHAYGWITDSGAVITVPSGRALVREATHDNLSRSEVRAQLRGDAADYRAHVTHVVVNLDKLPHRKGCWYEVGTIDADGKPGGVQVTNIEPLCKS